MEISFVLLIYFGAHNELHNAFIGKAVNPH